MDIIYEILLYVDAKTLKSFNMTHKHCYTKHFWVRKFMKDDVPAFNDYNIEEYKKLIVAKHTIHQLYQIRKLEDGFHGFMIHTYQIDINLLNIFPKVLNYYDLYYLNQSYFQLMDDTIVFYIHGDRRECQMTQNEIDLLLLRLLYEYPSIHINDGFDNPYYPLEYINEKLMKLKPNHPVLENRLLQRKVFWEKINY